MQQTSLFDCFRPISPDITASRHRGSATSIAANPTYEAKMRLIDQIRAFFVMMNNETYLHQICRELGKAPNEISPRLSDMKRDGELFETGKRAEKCAVLRLRKR